MIYFITLRELEMKDVTLARHLSSFIKKDEMLTLQTENEFRFVKDLVRHHPTNQKNFEHFLINPPNAILPSQVLHELHQRSSMIPTICYVLTEQTKDNHEQILEISRLRNHYQLMSLLMHAREKGWISDDTYPIHHIAKCNEVSANG